MKTVLITGASGMVGGHILSLCLDSPEIKQVFGLVRKPLGQEHDKLQEIIIDDFENLDEEAEYLKNIDIVYYCIGVYTGAVSREIFRQITVDYPVYLAKVLQKHSPEVSFCLLSGSGADRSEKSKMMFAKDKGAAENQLSAMGLGAFYTFRPAYIYPVVPRKEPNLSYRIFRGLYPLVKLFGRNASIKSTELAKGMFRVGIQGYPFEILENADILAVAQ